MIGKCSYICSNKSATGYCNSTVCVNPKYSNIGTAQYGQGVLKRIVTNADKIRAMEDEELAQFMFDYVDCYACPIGHDECPVNDESCKDIFLKWLKQEAQDG